MHWVLRRSLSFVVLDIHVIHLFWVVVKLGLRTTFSQSIDPHVSLDALLHLLSNPVITNKLVMNQIRQFPLDIFTDVERLDHKLGLYCTGSIFILLEALTLIWL